jgi:hypothetical protein
MDALDQFFAEAIEPDAPDFTPPARRPVTVAAPLSTQTA